MYRQVNFCGRHKRSARAAGGRTCGEAATAIKRPLPGRMGESFEFVAFLWHQSGGAGDERIEMAAASCAVR